VQSLWWDGSPETKSPERHQQSIPTSVAGWHPVALVGWRGSPGLASGPAQLDNPATGAKAECHSESQVDAKRLDFIG